MKVLALAVASLALAAAPPRAAPASPPAPAAAAAEPATRPAAVPRQFLARCVVSRPDAGKGSTVAARPQLLVSDGQTASIFVGSEVPSPAAPDAAEPLQVGLSVSLRVTPAADGTLRAGVRFVEGRLAGDDKDGPTVTEAATAAVRSAKPGEPVKLSLADGTTLHLTLTEVAGR